MPIQSFFQLPFFEGLNPEQLDLLCPLFVETECYAGTVLFDQNDPAIHLYLVISGEISIRFKPEDGEALTIARVHDGGVVGWSALIGRRLYTSAAIVTQYSALLRASGAELQSLCELHPETGLMLLDRFTSVIGERLSGTSPEIRAILMSSLRNGTITLEDNR
jgi:CRP-like cAMP-binding protein